ncbi:MAG: V-type ATPase subunit [Eubacterium sp.]|jgi:V/A-type H+-transporting ATPase subunit C|nr:V-type ATPase subunit [Eubacterium sp.]
MDYEKQYALAAKSRAIYGSRITSYEYLELSRKQSVGQVVAELKKTARYKNAMRQISESRAHRGQIELIVEKTVFDIYLRLFRFMAEDANGFGGFLIRKKEIEVILNTAMLINSGDIDRIIACLPLYLSGYLSFDLTAFAGIKNYDDLLKILKDTKYQRHLKALADTRNQDFNLDGFAVNIYGEHYYSLLKLIESRYKGELKKKLRDIIVREITLLNWSSAYRMKTMFNTQNDEIIKLLIPGGKRGEISEMIYDVNPENTMTKYLRSKLLKDNNEIGESKDMLIRKASYRYFKKELTTSGYGIIVMYSLIRLLEFEQQNITTVIEGVRYSLPSYEIEKMIVS